MTCLAYHKKSLYPTTFKQRRYKLKKQLPIDITLLSYSFTFPTSNEWHCGTW